METSRFEQYARMAAAALLVFGCVLVLRPFVGAMLFAGILVFSTWPAFVFLRDRWGGRGSLAALALVSVMVVALALPVAIAFAPTRAAIRALPASQTLNRISGVPGTWSLAKVSNLLVMPGLPFLYCSLEARKRFG